MQTRNLGDINLLRLLEKLKMVRIGQAFYAIFR